MARESKRIFWYSVGEETVRWIVTVVLTVIVVLAAGFGYADWERRNVERRAGEVLERSRGLTDLVQQEGGRASHRETFQKAMRSLAEGRRAQQEGDFRAALSKGEVGLGLLSSILESIQNPGRAGDARIIYVTGQVELRRGETGVFRRARPRDLMYEGDYVRSSGNGSAEILFGREGTLFTVRPGTLLKINRTRERSGEPQSVGVQYGWVDLSTSDEEGEVETSLAQLRVENESDASVALDRDQKVGRFAVERGSATVAASDSGETVALSELEQVVHQQGAFGATRSLPRTPEPESPENDFDLNLDRAQELALSWSPIAEATGYALQISRDRLFADNVIDVTERRLNRARLRALDEGSYYWRVAAQNDGRTSPWSEPQRFRVYSMGGVYWEDTVAPELTVDDVYVNGPILIVKGKTEPGVELRIDGKSIQVGPDGSFSRTITHQDTGLVALVVTAIDASGNRSEERREVLIEAL